MLSFALRACIQVLAHSCRKTFRSGRKLHFSIGCLSALKLSQMFVNVLLNYMLEHIEAQ